MSRPGRHSNKLCASSHWGSAYQSPAGSFTNGDRYGGPYTHSTAFAVPDRQLGRGSPMTGDGSGQDPRGLRFNGRRIPVLSRVVSWFTKSNKDLTVFEACVIGFAIAFLALVIGTVVVTQFILPDSSNGRNDEGTGGGMIQEESSGAGESEADGGAPSTPTTVVEYADNRSGSPVFADAEGDSVEGGSEVIPYETEVEVSCFTPDKSGIPSVNGFYLIASGGWKGDYVVADTMTNGGKIGDRSSPARDERVEDCTTAEE